MVNVNYARWIINNLIWVYFVAINLTQYPVHDVDALEFLQRVAHQKDNFIER